MLGADQAGRADGRRAGRAHYELYARGELSEPEEVADRLPAEPWRALEAGEPPDERGWASVQMLKHYVLAVEARYRAGAGTMLERTMVQRAPLPEPAPEPLTDLLVEALRAGYVMGVRAATTRRAPPMPEPAHPASPPAPVDPWGAQGGTWCGAHDGAWQASKSGTRPRPSPRTRGAASGHRHERPGNRPLTPMVLPGTPVTTARAESIFTLLSIPCVASKQRHA